MQFALAPWTFAMCVNTDLWQTAFAAVAAPLSGRAARTLPRSLPQIFGRASEATLIKALHPYRTRTTQNAKRLKQRAMSFKR